jgi:hypothetical protein
MAQVMAMALCPRSPADAGNVGDGIASGEELTIRQPFVHDAVNAMHLVHEAVDGVGELVRRIVAEMVRLAGLGPEIGHLPKQPLLDFDPAALILGIELAGLAAEILQNRPRLEDRDRPAAGSIMIDDRRHAIVG